MKACLLGIALVSLTLSVAAQPAAQPLKTTADARRVADQAVALFKTEKFPEAYEILKPHWPLPQVEIDSLANQTHTQWPMVRQRFGTSLATEFMRERKGGASLVEFTYLQKFERHGVRWTFLFYKPQDRWLVNSVAWDDDIDLLVE